MGKKKKKKPLFAPFPCACCCGLVLLFCAGAWADVKEGLGKNRTSPCPARPG